MLHSYRKRVGKLLCVCGREVHLVLVSLQKTCISGAVVPPEVTKGREEWGGESLTPLFSPPLLSTPPSLSPLLPPPEEFVVFCPITELQETIYCAILDCEDVQLILHSGEPCNCYSGSKRGECCYRVSSGVHILYPSTPLPLSPSPHLPISPSLPLPLSPYLLS